MIRLSMRGFMRHKNLDVELPDKGLFLVTGPNGSGKSTLVEAVSYGLWGRTLRGTEPWPEEGGELELETPVAKVHWKGGKKKAMSWSMRNEAGDGWLPPQGHGTMTKALEALEHLVGPWEVWRRTSVFSSQDAAHFTMSTDGERKRLLESLLGLDRFDTALELCRNELRQVNDAGVGLERKQAMVQIRLESEERRLLEACSMMEAAGATPVPAADNAKFKEMRDAANEERTVALAKYRELDIAGVSQDAKAREVSERLARLSSGACPTCGQPIPQAMVDGLKGEVQVLKEQALTKRALVKEELGLTGARIAELEEEWRAFNDRLVKADAVRQGAERESHARGQARTIAEEARKVLKALREESGALDAEAQTLTARLQVHQAVESVLGLRGVRAHILGRALSGLEAVADMWLSRIAKGLHVKLSSCTEKKGGGTVDAISLEVQGAGGGLGYRAASGGERRRIDVALLMALAEVAGAARSTKAPELLVFDEVFDALDPAGVESVSGAIANLALSRPVMIITHNPALAQAVSAGTYLRLV